MISRLVNIAALVGLLLAGVFAYGPYATTISLTKALENEDAQAVNAEVDFDALRASFNDDFAKKLGMTPPETLGKSIANRIAGAFLSELATPENMVMALKDKSRRERLGLSSDLMDIIIHSRWVDADTFILTNPDGAPATLLKRNGLSWQVTGMRLN